MNSSEIGSEEDYSHSFDENNNSAQFNVGSPLSIKTAISPISLNHQKSITTLVEDASNQLRAVTLPTDKEQIKFLDTLKIVNSPMQKLASLLDFLVEKVTSSSLEVTKMFKEMHSAKEEAKISDAKASRLLLHLQQNVKLLAQLATNNDETTLVQEAALNVQSVSSFETGIPSDYIRQLKLVLASNRDPMAHVEVLELLKQEISINSIMRRQTQALNQKSSSLMKSIEDIKAQMTNISVTKSEKMKQQIRKQRAFIKQICGLCGCEESHILETIQKSADQAKRNQASIELLSKKVQQMKAEHETQLSKFANENGKLVNEMNILKHQLGQYETAQKSAQKTRMKLCELLGIQANAKYTELEALIFAANQAIPVVINYKNIEKGLGIDPSQAGEYIEQLKEEISHLKVDQEKKKALMEKQAATIAELQDESWKKWGFDSEPNSNSNSSRKHSPLNNINFSHIHSIDDPESSFVHTTKSNTSLTENSMSIGEDSHFGELNNLKNEFSTIEKELHQLQSHLTQVGQDVDVI